MYVISLHNPLLPHVLQETDTRLMDRVVVRVTPEGDTIIVNEDGTETILQKMRQGLAGAGTGTSDEITMAAVKSILQDAGMNNSILPSVKMCVA